MVAVCCYRNYRLRQFSYISWLSVSRYLAWNRDSLALALLYCGSDSLLSSPCEPDEHFFSLQTISQRKMDIAVWYRASFVAGDSDRDDHGRAYNYGGRNDYRVCPTRPDFHGHDARRTTSNKPKTDSADRSRPQRVWRRHRDVRYRSILLCVVWHTFKKFVASFMSIGDRRVFSSDRNTSGGWLPGFYAPGSGSDRRGNIHNRISNVLQEHVF